MSRFDESPRADLGIAAAAGYLGAAGVALSALASHKFSSPQLVTAANFMVMHAVAVLAISSWSIRSQTAPGWWRAGARLLLLGTALFAGDIAAREIGSFSLFPMAAPIGGSAMILGWAVTAMAALVEWKRAGSGE